MDAGAIGALIPIFGIIMIICLALGVPLVRSYTRRKNAEPRGALPSGEMINRLDRIEQAIEAMATEVERIAEGQRFTTKLLSKDNTKSLSEPVANAAAAPASSSQPAPQGTILVEAARRP